MCFLASKCMHTHVGDRVLDERQPSLISSELPLWKDRHSEKGEGEAQGGLDKKSSVEREWEEAEGEENQVYWAQHGDLLD